eukprot:COSAG05_NODE_1354_length_5108_cov_24.726692_2_plen_102_part_00
MWQTFRILLVTAHPDDETMFFGPMLLSRQPGQKIFIYCLSTGNADGLGETRKKELMAATAALWIQCAAPPSAAFLLPSRGCNTVTAPIKWRSRTTRSYRMV